jgi:hypothetical protein
VKVEIELPELPGYEYTGEYREPKSGETALLEGVAYAYACSYKFPEKSFWNGPHFILRAKQKPKIALYQWLINHNTNRLEDTSDCGYRLICATEDHIVSMCKEFGWTFKKFNPSPLWSLDGDTL